jgi:hypothetical protein
MVPVHPLQSTERFGEQASRPLVPTVSTDSMAAKHRNKSEPRASSSSSCAKFGILLLPQIVWRSYSIRISMIVWSTRIMQECLSGYSGRRGLTRTRPLWHGMVSPKAMTKECAACASRLASFSDSKIYVLESSALGAHWAVPVSRVCEVGAFPSLGSLKAVEFCSQTGTDVN